MTKIALKDDVLLCNGVGIEHHFVADEVYLKRADIAAGTLLGKHSHPMDHASALVKGTVLLKIDDRPVRYISAPAMILIKAGQEHSIEAVTDVVWHCIHITSATDPESVDATILKG